MFNFFKKSKEPENIEDVLKGFRDLKKDFENLLAEVKFIKKKNRSSVQKIGLVRFNPFSDVGSNQSFSVALLNENDDGVVISSLYSREGNRIYGKTIRAGQSQHLLSKEEKQAIEAAKKSGNSEL